MANEVKFQGVGFGGLLTILFIGLKLGGCIAWPWLWVLSPLWIPLAFVLLICGVMLAFAAFVAIIAVMAK